MPNQLCVVAHVQMRVGAGLCSHQACDERLEQSDIGGDRVVRQLDELHSNNAANPPHPFNY